MKKELSWEYDISAKNMIDFTKDQEVGDFKVDAAIFLSDDNDTDINKNVLVSDNKQIYHMTDGIFILEVEEDGDVEYFYSEDINDLI